MSALSACDVVIVNFNAGESLAKTVSAVSSFCPQPIVVDNHSCDNSLSYLNVCRDTSCRLLRLSRNLGFAAACNIGMAAGRAEFVLFLNPDCRISPQSLAAMLAWAQEDARIGIVGALVCDPQGQEQRGARRALPTLANSWTRALLGRLSARFGQRHNFNASTPDYGDQPHTVGAVSGACLLARRQMLEALGGWDQGYFLHCEDLDLCARAWRGGWQVFSHPQARATHIGGLSSAPRPVRVAWHKHRGMLRYYRKFAAAPAWLRCVVHLGVWVRFGFLLPALLWQGWRHRWRAA